MLVVVLLAFRSADVTDAGAKLEHFPKNLFIRTRPAQCDAAGSLAYVRAVQAGANALAHVHFLGSAGVRTA